MAALLQRFGMAVLLVGEMADENAAAEEGSESDPVAGILDGEATAEGKEEEVIEQGAKQGEVDGIR